VRQWDSITNNGVKSFNLYNHISVPNHQLNEESTGSSLKAGMDTDVQTVAVGTSLSAGILSYIKTGTTSQKAWLDGTSKGTNANAVNVFTTTLVYAGGNQDGALGELIFIESALSDSYRQKIEGYLAHKWGLMASLPADHPSRYWGVPLVANAGIASQGVGVCTLRGMVTTGGFANAWICWGTNAPAENVTSAWANVASIGEVSQSNTFSTVASGLANNVTYWYRCYVSNDYGVAWSPLATSFSVYPYPWTPSNITCAAWYDAADVSSLTIDPANAEAGDQISLWADKSGNGRNVSRATGIAQPATGRRSIGGLNAIDFDGNDTMVNSGGIGISCTNVSVFVVRQWDSITNNGVKSFNLYNHISVPNHQLNEESTGSSIKAGMDTDVQTVAIGTSLAAGILSYIKTV